MNNTFINVGAKMIKKLGLFVLVACSICVLVFVSSSSDAYAKTLTVKGTTSYKKAPVVKKGTTRIVAKKGTKYVRFKANKTGTYRFTVSDFSSNNDAGKGHGSMAICTEGLFGLDEEFISTQGGYAFRLHVGTKKHVKKVKENRLKASACRTSRSGFINLVKGTTVYLKFDGSSYNTKKYKLNIKMFPLVQ